MKNFLVKMSRNSKIMVPVVAVVALGIYSGSYIIRHRDTVAKQEEQAQQEEARKAGENFQALEPEQKESTDQSPGDDSTTEKEQESTAESEAEKQAPDVEKVSMTVKASASDNSVTVSGTMTTSKPGICMATLLQKGVVLKSETNQASGGECTVILPRPSVSGEVKVQLTYRSDDSTAKGVEDTDVNL